MTPQDRDFDQETDGRVELAPGVRVAPAALEWSYTTSRGPGGQNVNRRDTRAVLRISIDELGLNEGARQRLLRFASRWLIDEDKVIQMSCEENRSQVRNREGCLEQLRALLVMIAKPPRVRKKTKPSRGAVERRLQEKRERSQIKARRGKRPGGGQGE